MNDVLSAAQRLCAATTTIKSMPSPAVRIAAWLIGVAQKQGGFPVQVSYRQIQAGFERDGVQVQGTGCHNATIRESLQWLSDNGLVTMQQGKHSGGGHHAVVVGVPQ